MGQHVEGRGKLLDSTETTRIWSEGRPLKPAFYGVALSLICLAWSSSAFAAINVTIGLPSAGSLQADALLVTAAVDSTYEVASVQATVGPVSGDLVYGGTNAWSKDLSIASLGFGKFTLTVTATDRLSNQASATVDFQHDRPPTLTVLAPADVWEVARPGLRVAATCTDDGPSPCTVSVGTKLTEFDQNWAPLASATSALDQVVSLAPFEGKYVHLRFMARDASGQDAAGVVKAWVAVESSPALVEVDRAPGFIYDADARRILYMDWPDGFGMGHLSLLDRSTRAITAIGTQFGGIFFEPAVATDQTGYTTIAAQLTSVGAAYQRASFRYGGGFWDFRGPSSTLIETDAFASVTKRADYAIWDGYGQNLPGPAGTSRLLRDFQQQATAVVTAGATVAPNGDLLYVSGGDIWRVKLGVASQLTTTGTVSSTAPISSDGQHVLYVDSIAGMPWLMMVDDGGTKQIAPGATSYQVSGGWVAFTKPGAANGPAQVWRRAPDGTSTQVTFLGTPSAIQGLAPDGTIIAASSGRHYLAVPGGPLITPDVGSDFPGNFPNPRVTFQSPKGLRDALIDGAWHTAVGGTLFRIAPCDPDAGPCSTDGGATPADAPGVPNDATDASSDRAPRTDATDGSSLDARAADDASLRDVVTDAGASTADSDARDASGPFDARGPTDGAAADSSGATEGPVESDCACRLGRTAPDDHLADLGALLLAVCLRSRRRRPKPANGAVRRTPTPPTSFESASLRVHRNEVSRSGRKVR
jgi:hypothetical protein